MLIEDDGAKSHAYELTVFEQCPSCLQQPRFVSFSLTPDVLRTTRAAQTANEWSTLNSETIRLGINPNSRKYPQLLRNVNVVRLLSKLYVLVL
jgi:hypothetical protein